MPESRAVAIAIKPEAVPTVSGRALQSSMTLLVRVGTWAGDTAQKFGSLVSALMGPAVLSAYSIAAWSLASSLGWANTFLFGSGPLSNWMVWLGIAVLIHGAAAILKRHTQGNA